MKGIKKFFKWFALIILLLIVFIIAAPFIFKGKIIERVKEEANKNLNAKVNFGDFDLTLFSSFPNFSLSVDDVSIANIGVFEGDTLFSAKNFTASLNLMSVIKGDQYEIRKISLVDPRIKATVLKDGTASYDITKPSEDTTTTAGEPTKFKMSLKLLEIKNGTLVYDDATLDYRMNVDSMNYTMSGDFTQDNFVMENDFSASKMNVVYAGITYLRSVRTKLNAALDADMKNMKFTFRDNKLALNELSMGMNGWFAMPKEGYDMDLSFKCNEGEFKSFLSLIPAAYSSDFASVKTSGTLAFNGYAKGLYTDTKMPAFGLKLKIDKAMFQYPSLPKAATNIVVDLEVENKTGDLNATVTDLRKFHVDFGGNPVDATMHVETPVSDPAIAGAIMCKLDLKTLKDVVPLDKGDDLNGLITSDVKLKGRYSSIEKEKYEEFDASGKIEVKDMMYKTKDLPPTSVKTMVLTFSPKFVALDNFDAQVGRSDYAANGRIENFMQYVFKDSLLTGSFDLRSKVIDLNEFMGSEETTATQPQQPDTASMSVIAVPGNIDFKLSTTIGKLLYDDLNMDNVSGEVIIRDSKVNMKDLRMNLLGGSMVMGGVYSTENEKSPRVDFNMNAKDFDIQQTNKAFNTVQKLAPVAKYANGRFNTELKFKATLDSKMMPVMSTLEGGGRLQTKKVTVSNFEPLVALAEKLGGFDKFKKAEFGDLDIKYSFRDGKVSTDEFPFKSGSVAGFMAGATGFDQTVNYKMNFEVPTKDMPSGMKTQVTGLLSKSNMLGVNMQLPEKVKLNALIGGTVTKPVVTTDVKELTGKVVESLKDTLKGVVKEKVKEIKEDIKKDLTKEKEKIMKDAAIAAQQVKDEAKKLSDQVRKEGYAKADELEKSAKNPVEKIAKKKAADKLRKETDEKADKIIADANKKADDIMKDAQARSDALK